MVKLNKAIMSELPPNYDELKKSANRTSNWRERFDAIEELGKWKHKRTIDVLVNRMENDAVYKLQEAAYRHLKSFGEDVSMPTQKKGDLIKDASKVFVRIKKSLPAGHTYEEYKEKLKNMRLDLFDTYEGEKGTEFDSWLKKTWEEAATRR